MSGDFTFMKGNIDIIILCSLCDNDKYGYEIAKEIKEKTSNRYEIKQPTLYSYLKRLEEDDLIVSYWGEASNGGRRRYYKITPQGRKDCEAFVSEWQYQRNIMSDLVDDTATGKEISQKDATPLFGRKVTSKRSRKSVRQSAFDEQDEISRRLRELAGDNDAETETKPSDTFRVTETSQTLLFDVTEQTSTAKDDVSDKTSEAASASADVATEARQDTLFEQYRTPEPEISEEDLKSRFQVKQDDADVFAKDFETLAKEIALRRPNGDADEGENYQHILLDVLGDQLDEAKDIDSSMNSSIPYYSNHPAALEEVADDLAKEGIRVRIYNHATAAYKSKQLMPQAKVLCQASIAAYVLPLIYFTVLALCSISIDNWKSSLITVCLMLLIPIAFTVYAVVDPTRKDKPSFNFHKTLLAATLFGLIVVLLAIGISTLNKIEFSNFAEVTNKILLPLGIVLYAPVFVIIYNALYKKY